MREILLSSGFSYINRCSEIIACHDEHRQVVLFELIIPFEENLIDAARWKRKRYEGLRYNFINGEWWAKVYRGQIGSRGLLDISSLDSIEEFVFPGQSRLLSLLLLHQL